jgi:hypothetical protein
MAFIHISIGVKKSPFVGTLNVNNISGVNDILPFVFIDSQFHIQGSDCGKYFFNIITQTVAIDYNFSLSILLVSVDSYFHILDYAVHISFVQAIPAQPAKIHAQNAIFSSRVALAQRIYAPIILVNR